MVGNNNDSRIPPEQQRSVTSTPAIRRYLSERGFSDSEQADLIERGWIRQVDADEVTQLVKPISDPADFNEYLWIPRRQPSGKIIAEHGHMIMLKVCPFTKQLRTEKVNPPAEQAPNHASFYGDGWYGYDGKVTVHESALKAMLEYVKTGAMTIGLNGINGITYSDNGTSRIIPELHDPPWDRAASVSICFDSPKKGSKSSRENLSKAKQRLVELLSESVSAVYDRSVPVPTDNRESQDINDYYMEIRDETFTYLDRRKRKFFDSMAARGSLISHQEAMARPPIQWLVQGVVAKNDVTAIVGPTSCGKSFLTMDLLLAIGAGRETWLGQPIHAEGFTVHVSLEGSGMPSRLRAFEQVNGEVTDHYLYETPICISDADQTARLVEQVHDLATHLGKPLAALAIDTVNRTMGGNENDAEAMRNYTAQLERLQIEFPSAAILAVHHTGKNEAAGSRGSSVFESNLGSVLTIKPKAEGVREVYVTKCRDGEANRTLNYFKLAVQDIKDGDTSCVVELAAPVMDDELDLHRCVHEIWEDEGGESVAKSWFRQPELRRRLKDDFGINRSRTQIDEHFEQWVATGIVMPTGEQISGRDRYTVAAPRSEDEEKF